ncbi:hypothetical protein J4H92_14305 [Leucobacter weissii]|uniref:Uncharacterized protein n=1 Tax=Leucobacter weissii TaxID=1983706 RepID=A0A939MLT9_9MICO|nr:hypothetical protein [Leucobacter weissii]MBO1903113.1 hypothetical protein [Leucobacter weissii]
MNTESVRDRPRGGRILAAAIVLAVGSMLLLASLLAAIPMLLNHFADMWNGFGDISTFRLPFDQDPDTPDPASTATYSGVLLSSAQPLTLPRILQLGHTALTLLVVIAGSLAAILLAIRLLQRRPFARHLRWSLIVFGLLVVVLATVGPQLDALAVDVAAKELGYPIYQDVSTGELTAATPDSIMLNLWDPIWVVGRFELILLLVGGTVALIGFLVSDGERLQRDSEGLV